MKLIGANESFPVHFFWGPRAAVQALRRGWANAYLSCCETMNHSACETEELCSTYLLPKSFKMIYRACSEKLHEKICNITIDAAAFRKMLDESLGWNSAGGKEFPSIGIRGFAGYLQKCKKALSDEFYDACYRDYEARHPFAAARDSAFLASGHPDLFGNCTLANDFDRDCHSSNETSPENITLTEATTPESFILTEDTDYNQLAAMIAGVVGVAVGAGLVAHCLYKKYVQHQNYNRALSALPAVGDTL